MKTFEKLKLEKITRCCGRCNGVDDLCYNDMVCDDQAIKIIKTFCESRGFDYYIIGDDPFNVIEVNEMYVCFSDILLAHRNKMSADDFTEWYWEHWYDMDGKGLNLRTYLKLKNYEKKH